jgi:hypothetical protein
MALRSSGGDALMRAERMKDAQLRGMTWVVAVAAAIALEGAGATQARADACPADAKASYARVELYRELNCVRPSVSLGFAGDGDRPNFAAFANYEGIVFDVDDSRSSLAVAAATCVRLFDGRDFTGADSGLLCAPAGAVGYFADLGAFNDRASSMRVCPLSAQGGCDRPAPAPPPPPPAPNGSPASTQAQLSAVFARGRARRTVGFGRRARVRVALADELGRPIAGAAVQVRTRERSAGAEWRLAPALTTGADGRAVLVLERGPSRQVALEYRAHVADEQPVTVDIVRLNVRAGVTLTVRPRRLRSGGTMRLAGRLLASPATDIGKVVTLQAREAGRWRDFENVRTRRGGRFSARYRFSRRARGSFPIRAVARADAAYPYATGRSPTVRVRVR